MLMSQCTCRAAASIRREQCARMAVAATAEAVAVQCEAPQPYSRIAAIVMQSAAHRRNRIAHGDVDVFARVLVGEVRPEVPSNPCRVLNQYSPIQRKVADCR